MKRMLSGIKPSGQLTLGNYLGAIKPFVQFQDNYELFVFIANLHALTLDIQAEDLKKNTNDLICIYLAAGLDPKKCTIFKQSDVPAHNQLEWILTCNTDLPDLLKMPQYKNFCEHNKNVATPTGMLMYPSLMNADILLYDADYVPVGIDQKPHVDLTRTVASKFNKKHNNIFKLPEPVVTKSGAKIMSLSDPTKKMSKSESNKGTIYLLDDVEITRKKIMKALTDNEDKVYYDPINKPGISNLLNIYCAISGCTMEAAENEFNDIENYGVFKRAVADVVCNEIIRLQKEIKRIKDPVSCINLNYILKKGAQKANDIANKKLNIIYKELGLVEND